MRPDRWTLLLTVCLSGAVALVHTVNRLGWRPGHLFESPSIAISGDEPHYLLVLHSLLYDHDLELNPDYLRVARGGWGAGRSFRFVPLDHHTVLFDPASGKSKLWQDVFDWQVRECRAPDCEGWRRLTPDFPAGMPRREVSAHPIAYSALLALVLAPFRIPPERVEGAANLVVQLFACLGLVLTFLAGRAAGFTRLQALGAAALVLGSPWLPYSRSFFVELPAGVFAVAGLLAMQRGRPWAAGLAAGAAFALKPPFLLFGVGWFLERLLARRWRDAFALAVPLGLWGAGIGLFNRLTAGRWVVSGTSGWEWARGLESLVSNLVHREHGVLPFVPWVAIALVALGLAVVRAVRGAGEASLGLQLALPFLLYFAMIAVNRHLGATCYGPRYWVAFLPLLALASVDLLRRWPAHARVTTALLLAAGLYSAAIALPASVRYPQLWDREATAAWTR